MDIKDLLNPAGHEEEKESSTPQCTPASKQETAISTFLPPFKKQKMAKDAAIFTRGKVTGEIRFPPFEDYDEKTIADLMGFFVFPIGQISEYRRHIPYNSDKKNFLQKTGRGAFEGK
jgi:hypothetical protein